MVIKLGYGFVPSKWLHTQAFVMHEDAMGQPYSVTVRATYRDGNTHHQVWPRGLTSLVVAYEAKN